jgi:hypothetical protein
MSGLPTGIGCGVSAGVDVDTRVVGEDRGVGTGVDVDTKSVGEGRCVGTGVDVNTGRCSEPAGGVSVSAPPLQATVNNKTYTHRNDRPFKATYPPAG